jgi:hypothetical protein
MPLKIDQSTACDDLAMAHSEMAHARPNPSYVEVPPSLLVSDHIKETLTHLAQVRPIMIRESLLEDFKGS